MFVVCLLVLLKIEDFVLRLTFLSKKSIKTLNV